MLPPVDIHYLAEELARLGEEVERAWDDSPDPEGTAPRVLVQGLDDLFDALSAAEPDSLAGSQEALRTATGASPDALLSHGLALLAQLTDQAERLGLPGTARALEGLSLPLTCWLLRRGAELEHPELVVNAAAALANRLREPDDLAALYALLTELMEGLSPAHTQEPPVTPHRPWRVLLLNRAIVATRSHRPALMVTAFDGLCEHLPADASDFFREGMGQMEALDYPPQVREVMQRYYDRWSAGQRLH